MVNKTQQDFSDMQVGKPLATYKKAILGKVYVTVLSPFSGEPEGVILYTDPKNADNQFIDIWSEKELIFFLRRNKTHIDNGTIIKVEREVVEEEHTIEKFSDDELREILSKRYTSLQKILRETNSEAVIYRLLDIAREEDKSVAVIEAIEAKLSDLQLASTESKSME